MRKAVTIDDFLEFEEEARKIAKLRAPAREVRRFHAAVRRFAGEWTQLPRRRVMSSSSAQGVVLHLEMEDRQGWISIMTLRAIHTKGEFCLKGPGPVGKVAMSVQLRKALDAILKTWLDLPGAEGTKTVTVHLPKIADSGFDRYLEIAVSELNAVD